MIVLLLEAYRRRYVLRCNEALAATNAWCDAGVAVCNHIFAHQRLTLEDPEFRRLVKLEAIAYEEFLRTHTFCKGPGADAHLEWYRSIYDWQPILGPPPKNW